MTSAPLITYHGDPAFKTAFLAEIAKHEAADQIIKGTYGKINGEWKGCAIGCSLRSLNLLTGYPHNWQTAAHGRFPLELGWPLWLVRLEDELFERLPEVLAKTWPRRLAEAIPVGVHVPDVVVAKILRWIFVDESYGVVTMTKDSAAQEITKRMGQLLDRIIAGGIVPQEEWDEALWGATDAWAEWAARDGIAARAEWGVMDALDAMAAWGAMVVRDTMNAKVAMAVRNTINARAAWGSRDTRAKLATFSPALSEELLAHLRALEAS